MDLFAWYTDEGGVLSDAAIANMVTGVVTVTTLVIGFLTVYIKMKYGDQKTEELTQKTEQVSHKLDDNTNITRTTGTAAATNARAAASAATEAAQQTKEISSKLNGGVDSAIRRAIEPVQKVLAEHAALDEKSVKEVNEKLVRLEEYVHERNHEILNAINKYATKIELVLQLAAQQNQVQGKK